MYTTYFYFTFSFIYLLVFLKAYFPIEQTEVHENEPPEYLYDYKFNLSEVYRPDIDRLVFIIIDALREDFVRSDYMPYTFRESNCVISVKVESPTVTLPRIKALTTGGVPQFIDIILNFGSTTKCEDSFLHRAYKAKKNMVFYGDDTWIKLFPEMFVRKDGTNSFFVNDFYEVDNNITRHLDAELLNNDWDIMFLHYLGLDHIGHVKGPFSDLIPIKLKEMDGIIERIHKTLIDQPKRTLILITGDHGMKDSGGHGGTTHSEMHVPLILFGLPCKNTEKISQSDIPTTLSVLFGIEIPSTTVGKIITSLFNTTDKLLYSLYYNLRTLSLKSSEEIVSTTKMHRDVLKGDLRSKTDLLRMYEQNLQRISLNLIQKSVEQNTELLLLSVLLSVITFLMILNRYNLRLGFLTPVLLIFSGYKIIFIPVFFILLYQIFILSRRIRFLKSFLISPIVFHAIILQSSSFIEEEHQIFINFFCTLSLLFAYHFSKNSVYKSGAFLIPFILIRFLRTLNSTGDQWASYPDLSDWLQKDSNIFYLKLFYIFSLISLYSVIFFTLKFLNSKENVLVILTLNFIFIFKIYYTNSVGLARLIWGLIAFYTLITKFTFKNLILVWILTTSLLLKPNNCILLPCNILISFLYKKFLKKPELLFISHFWLGYTLYFCQGHSNSLASIDIAPAYIGLNSYVPAFVFLFTLCHIYTFPILSFLLLLYSDGRNVKDFFVLNVIYRLVILLSIFVVVFVQRGHLFIWSVFAPKLLIESVHVTVLYCFYSIYMLWNVFVKFFDVYKKKFVKKC